MLVVIDNAKLRQHKTLKHGGLTQVDGQFFSCRLKNKGLIMFYTGMNAGRVQNPTSVSPDSNFPYKL